MVRTLAFQANSPGSNPGRRIPLSDVNFLYNGGVIIIGDRVTGKKPVKGEETEPDKKPFAAKLTLKKLKGEI